jgi:hypothetical protein
MVECSARIELKFHPKSLPLFWPSPSLYHAYRYNMSISLEHHPSTDHLVIDWYWPGLTPWTSKTAALLAHKFYVDHQQIIFPGIEQRLQEKRIALLFTKYILRMKTYYIEKLEDFPQFQFLQGLLEDETDFDDDEVETESEETAENSEDPSDTEENAEDEDHSTNSE